MAEPVVAAAPVAAAPVAPVVAPVAAPVAAPVVAAPAAPVATPDAPDGNILGDAGKAAAAAAAAAPPALDAVKAFLTEKGAKPEELAALDETALRAKYDEAKAAEVKKAGEPPKPEDFAVKAPEGVEVDPKLMGEFQAALADANLSPAERAQKLFDLHQAQLTQAVESSTKLWMKTQADWQAAWKADPEIGGANMDTVTSTIAKALDQIGGAESAKIREAFVFTGAGNNTEIGRMFYRMAKALTEGGAITGDTPAKLGASEEARLMALYPTAAKAR